MKKSRLLGCVNACVLFISQAAYAVAVYTYQGNDFDVFTDDTLPSGSFSTGQSISVTLTFSNPLLKAPFKTQHPITFSISDGINTIDNTTNPDFPQFKFSTNSPGEINSWSFDVWQKLFSTIPWSAGETTRRMITSSTGSFDASIHYSCVTTGGGRLVQVMHLMKQE